VDIPYISAEEYNLRHGTEDLRTIMEQHRNPYPHNLQTACYYEVDWIEDDDKDLDDVLTFESWNNQKNHKDCLLPCAVMEREKHDDDVNGATTLYMAKLIDSYPDNVSINWECHIYVKYEYFYTDIPREGIIFTDKPFSTDTWLPHALRQPIGLPDTMVPDIWKKRNIRRRPVTSVDNGNKEIDRETFKRKVVTNKQEALDAIRIKADSSLRMDL